MIETPSPPIKRPALLLTQKEAADVCRCCKKSLYLAAKRGQLRQVKIGRAVRYRPADLEAWIDRLQGVQEGGGNG